MPQYLVAIHHPDDFDPSLEDAAKMRDISALNEEMSPLTRQRTERIPTSLLSLGERICPNLRHRHPENEHAGRNAAH